MKANAYYQTQAARNMDKEPMPQNALNVILDIRLIHQATNVWKTSRQSQTVTVLNGKMEYVLDAQLGPTSINRPNSANLLILSARLMIQIRVTASLVTQLSSWMMESAKKTFFSRTKIPTVLASMMMGPVLNVPLGSFSAEMVNVQAPTRFVRPSTRTMGIV